MRQALLWVREDVLALGRIHLFFKRACLFSLRFMLWYFSQTRKEDT